ncbi:securin [Athene cunicularia]|uniref:Securin n=1 Tax=Athene cunicularia TaxID=194338 RepID=A0A663MS85_ATHCN|nr:securin [Athene cunicularia]XP_026714029.1 securin [Athene cunicularia]XP_026714030.1 securin [Athene cunicularia]
MATLIFIDKENGEVGAPKNQLRLPSGSSKVLSERTQVSTPLPKKAISTSPAISHSVRKALGNVNRTQGVMSKMEKLRQKNQPCTASKITEKNSGLESCDAVSEEDWPEIENMFPYDPQDFESFDLPEDLKVSNINLCGVPLMMFERTYDRCVNMVPSPVKIEEFSWESNLLQSTTDFLATLDEIVDMPPPNYDI